MKKEYPQVTYGAVYFRKSNPPQADWERDYAQAAKDGMNTFRHWFMWGAVELAPEKYDWSEFDRQLDLAADNGMGTIIAEFSETVPEWFYHNNKSCFSVMRDGTQAPYSGMGASTVVGGFVPGHLCLDNPETRVYVERYLRALATRYKGHPGLLGYDVWNECNYHPDTCFCEHTQKKFRLWLQKKYGTLEALSKAWNRYGYTDWDQVEAPRHKEQYADAFDWLLFRKQNFFELFKWKADIIRSIDPDAHITAHGVAASLDYTYGDGNDDWLSAEQVDSYGMTWVMSRKGTEPWKQWQAVDLLRNSSRGKTFWHAEMQGGPLWLQPQVIGREKEDGRVSTADDVRLWNLVSLAGGARGVLYLRWRSLLDGPLFGAFGLYNMDGTPNDRSAEASKIAKWANSPETKGLFSAQPVKAPIGIVILDEIQEFSRLMQQAGPQKFYARCQWGAYQAFFDSGVDVDFVNFADIDQYKALYFAYPIYLSAEQAKKLADWVKKGGKLICEGLPGYFGDNGKVGTVQPNNGLDKLFGVHERTVEFMPDLGDRIFMNAVNVENVPGGLFRQSYDLDSGTELLGAYPDGEASASCCKYGDGTAILLGSFPSEGYFRTGDAAVREMLCKLLDKIGVAASVNVTGNLSARLCADGSDKYLWVINHTNEPQSGTVTADGVSGVAEILWGQKDSAGFENSAVCVSVPAKDAVVVKIKN